MKAVSSIEQIDQHRVQTQQPGEYSTHFCSGYQIGEASDGERRGSSESGKVTAGRRPA
jgi:hypothetical protein